MAVPPAYAEVRYSPPIPHSHLQAVGRDAAGRLQYRYHPEWERVRETQKAQRLGALVEVLPKIRRAVTQHLATSETSKAFALAAVIELIAGTALRPGSEEYARKHGTRGASTLLKSNVRLSGDNITLVFRGKGSKDIRKEFTDARLASAITTLRTLPGPRLFQYKDVRRHPAGQYARGQRLPQGDRRLQRAAEGFPHPLASAAVLDNLARMVPADSAKKRRKQVLDAVKAAAEELTNTPAMCRRAMCTRPSSRRSRKALWKVLPRP